MKETTDANQALFLLQSLKKQLLKTREESHSQDKDDSTSVSSVTKSRSIRLQQFKLGIVECVYKVLQTCELMEDKRALVGLEIIALLFEDEFVRNKVFEDDAFARACIEEHSQFIFRFLPVGLLQGSHCFVS